MNSAELKRQRAERMAAATTLATTARTEARALTTEEQTTFDAHVTAVEALDRQIDVALRFERLGAVGQPGERVSDPLLPHNDPSNAGARHGYSLLKALREAHMGAQSGTWVTGIERETHDELVKLRIANGGKPPTGVLVPWNLPVDVRMAGRFASSSAFAMVGGDVQRRAGMDTVAGVGSIPTILDATMIDLLRNRMVVAGLGATILTDMQGLFAIPRQSSASTLVWIPENGPATDSNATIDQVPFSPKTASAQMTLSRRFIHLTNQDAENFARNDLTKVVALGFDAASLVGTGLSNQPLGIQNNTNVPVVAAGTNGAAPVWANIVDLESSPASLNADIGKQAYICNGKLRGTLKKTVKVAAYPVFLWNSDVPTTPLNGYNVGVTNQLPSNLTKGTGTNLTSLLFGDWESLIICMWSGLDVVVDPYTNSSSGALKVVCLQDADINIRHPESFARCIDLIP